MSDSRFVFASRDRWRGDGWEKEVLLPDELEFPPEVESQLAQVLAMDEGDFELGDWGGAQAKAAQTRRGRPDEREDDVWEDLGLEDFVLAVQREQRLGLPLAAPQPNGGGGEDGEDEEDGEGTPTGSFASQ